MYVSGLVSVAARKVSCTYQWIIRNTTTVKLILTIWLESCFRRSAGREDKKTGVPVVSTAHQRAAAAVSSNCWNASASSSERKWRHGHLLGQRVQLRSTSTSCLCISTRRSPRAAALTTGHAHRTTPTQTMATQMMMMRTMMDSRRHRCSKLFDSDAILPVSLPLDLSPSKLQYVYTRSPSVVTLARPPRRRSLLPPEKFLIVFFR